MLDSEGVRECRRSDDCDCCWIPSAPEEEVDDLREPRDILICLVVVLYVFDAEYCGVCFECWWMFTLLLDCLMLECLFESAYPQRCYPSIYSIRAMAYRKQTALC